MPSEIGCFPALILNEVILSNLIPSRPPTEVELLWNLQWIMPVEARKAGPIVADCTDQ